MHHLRQRMSCRLHRRTSCLPQCCCASEIEPSSRATSCSGSMPLLEYTATIRLSGKLRTQMNSILSAGLCGYTSMAIMVVWSQAVVCGERAEYHEADHHSHATTQGKIAVRAGSGAIFRRPKRRVVDIDLPDQPRGRLLPIDSVRVQ